MENGTRLMLKKYFEAVKSIPKKRIELMQTSAKMKSNFNNYLICSDFHK